MAVLYVIISVTNISVPILVTCFDNLNINSDNTKLLLWKKLGIIQFISKCVGMQENSMQICTESEMKESEYRGFAGFTFVKMFISF
jgi:hypothetical protein